MIQIIQPFFEILRLNTSQIAINSLTELNSSDVLGTSNLTEGQLEEFPADSNVCKYQRFGFLQLRFTFMVIIMGGICVFGIIGNILVALVYIRRGISSANSFLAALAFGDLGVLVCSFLLYSVEILYDAIENFQLYTIWFQYVIFIFGISHFFQWLACYMVIMATVERFLSLNFQQKVHNSLCGRSRSLIFIIIVAILSFLFTFSKFFEVEVRTVENCNDFGRFKLRPGPLLENEIYALYYGTIFANIFGVFFPFAVLAVLNVLILRRMDEGLAREKMQRRQVLGVARNFFMKPILKRIQRQIKDCASGNFVSFLLLNLL